VNLLPNAISNVLTPSVARIPQAMDQRIKLITVFQRFWLLSLGLAVVLILLIGPTITLVYGSDFADAELPAQILVIGATLWGLKTVLAGGAKALNDPLLPSRAELIASIYTIIALVIFLPQYGIVGAAVISVLAYAIALIIILLGLWRRNQINLVELFRMDKPTSFFLQQVRLLFKRSNRHS
jgi:O-antigen/teichoic acid export membrane protein